MARNELTAATSGRVAVVVVAFGLLLAAPAPVEARKKRAMIVIYDGFGTPLKARIWGRVLEDKGFDKPKERERWYRRLRRSYRLLESDEIEDAKLVLKVGKLRFPLKSDDDGMFQVEIEGLKVGTHEVNAALVSTMPFRVMSGRIFVGRKLPAKPPRGAQRHRLAVLSDIDDTVLQTGVKNKLKLIKKVLFSNATQLKTYGYASALYRELVDAGAPLVFVSGSPINLYPRLHAFFRLRGFPRAPMLLKNLGSGRGSDSLFGQKKYKLKRIREALDLLPGYRFILIGDSGEKDPEIYRAVAKQYPERVAAVLIHNVSKAKASEARFARQFLFADYRAAARYLAQKKLLSAAASKRIDRGERADKK